MSDDRDPKPAAPPRLGRRALLGSAAAASALALSGLPLVPGASARSRGPYPPMEGRWIGTWYASPQEPTIGLNPAEEPRSFADQTIRQVARVSIGGERVRIRFSNEIGDQPLSIGGASIALQASGASIQAGTLRRLTFAGEPATIVPAGAPVLSDPVDFDLPELSSLVVTLYLPEETGPATAHLLGRQTAYVVSGDATGATDLPGAETTESRYFLTGVQVVADESAAAIVTLGDSITDGFAATTDQNRRWPDILAERLARRARGPERPVLNAGISGNRVLNDIIGPNAQARFDRDVLAQPGVRYLTILEGINDIGFGTFLPDQVVSAEQIIAGYRQLIERAHSRGIAVFGATLTPFEGAGYFTEAGEAKRQAVNDWIRNSGAFDAVIDFDRVTRDPSNPRRLRPEYDSGDRLHPSDAGYAAMAESIDLNLFRGDKDWFRVWR